MSTPGIEPGPTLWKSAILTTILRGLFSTFYKRLELIYMLSFSDYFGKLKLRLYGNKH